MQINKWHSTMAVLTGVIFHAGTKGRSILILQGSEQYFNCRTLHLTPSFKYHTIYVFFFIVIAIKYIKVLLQHFSEHGLPCHWSNIGLGQKGETLKRAKKLDIIKSWRCFLGRTSSAPPVAPPWARHLINKNRMFLCQVYWLNNEHAWCTLVKATR